MKSKRDRGLVVFINECEKWRKILAPEFDITYETREESGFAIVDYQLGAGTAEITVSENHLLDNDYELRKTALEEILHLVFAEYRNLADGFMSTAFVDLQEHKIINKIKSILIKK